MNGSISNRYITFFLIIIVTLVTASSCVPSAGKKSKRKTKKDSDSSNAQTSSNETEKAEFKNSLNYFQNGSVTATTSLTLSTSFENSFYLRGAEVDFYIREVSNDKTQCLAFSYPSSLDKKVLVIKASPRDFYNYSTKTQEFYYLMSPSDGQLNQSFCLKPGIINKMSTLYPGAGLAFDLKSLCPSCTQSSALTSKQTGLYTESGNQIETIQIENISLKLQNTVESTIPVNSCTTQQECTNLNYSCCSNNICINDKTIKSSTDTSSTEFLQALAIIENSPEKIYDFSNFYNLCSQAPVVDKEIKQVDTSIDPAKERLDQLKELYDCTTSSEGEMSICTDIFKDASLDTDNTFTIDLSDKNFTNTHQGTTALDNNSIIEVVYADKILDHTVTTDGVTVSLANDDLTTAMSVLLTATAASSSSKDILKVRYKVDGSCKKINAGVAKCIKYYTQGQDLKKVNDHTPNDQNFKIPNYADITKIIQVDVDGDIKYKDTDWTLSTVAADSTIVFSATSKVYDTQIVKISYYVDLTLNPNLMNKLDSAQDELATLCECPDKNCSLEQVLSEESNGTSTVVDYKCVYPDADLPPPPLQQQFSISSKTIPVRFFDQDGGGHDEPDLNKLTQEGTLFEYTKNDLLKPNNITNTIGFNEIYGSITNKYGSAKPPKMVRVTKGKSYDIFTDNGSFSSCLNCGTDYYSNLARLFPGSFSERGGGFTPDTSTSNPFKTTKYRADDLLFGRACFVPVTMLPHSHKAMTLREDQRKARMNTQHFLFSNGMNRDWYGFDYGSVIGSFDGVAWFSIGNQRRITAKTNKLYIAVNAYFADLTTENSFQITVTESSAVSNSGSAVTTDFESDGAQCQQHYVCSNDSDCASSLGWDYACESIGNAKTIWPKFDSNGLEIPGAETIEKFVSLTGPQISGGTLRCVYRGKGSSCDQNYTNVLASNTFNFTDKARLLGCSSNNYCQSLPGPNSGTTFNNKISRYGKSVKSQNSSSSVTESDLDLYGLGSRIIGRPYNYNGTNSIPTDAYNNLIANNVNGICIPGRDVSTTTLSFLQFAVPTDEYKGDQVTGNGMTASGLGYKSNYVSSCSNLDVNGDYIQFESSLFNLSTTHTSITNIAGTQSISSNALNQIEQLYNKKITSNFKTEFVEEASIEQNRCLRAPGASCFSDLDCAPSDLISKKIKGMDPDGFLTSINSYEIKFWQEELICSNDKKDGVSEIKNNRCCRELGKNISIATADHPNTPSIINTDLLPGVEIALDSRTRYSRNATSHYLRRTNPTTYPIMRASGKDACPGANCFNNSFLKNQFNTINEVASRTCCSKNWVREFDSSNGGGHLWSPQRMQKIEKSNFRCLNWAPSVDVSATFSCAGKNPLDPNECSARSVSDVQANQALDWLSKFELLGIPQIGIESEMFSETHCGVKPDDVRVSGSGYIIPGFVSTSGPDSEYTDELQAGFEVFSAQDLTNYDSKLKRIFSEDTFACCSPLGTKMNGQSEANLCCSGYINPDDNQCALKNYTNLSVYFNRYVSSEANSLPTSSFNTRTGYIDSEALVEQLACQIDACASGVVGRGLAWTELKITGLPDHETTVKRFLDGDGPENNYQGKASLFNEGMRWNNHVYCIPEEINTDSQEIAVFKCNP